MRFVGVFVGAWSLYRRNVGWLIIAGIIAGAISGAVMLLSVALGGAVGFATFGHVSSGDSVNGASLVRGLSGMMVIIVCGVLVAELLMLALQGGMMKMVIDSGRSGRGAQLGDLFAGFSRLPAYVGFGLIVVFAVPAGCAVVFSVVGKLAPILLLIAIPACFVALVWLYVSWVYAVALIADRGLGPIAALTRSREMVRRVGWFSTFGLLLVVVILSWVVSALLSGAIAMVVGRTAGGGTSLFGMSLVDIVIMPYLVCFLASMYLGSEAGKAAPVYGGPPSYDPGYGPYGGGPVAPAPFDPYAAPTPYYPGPAGYAPPAPPPPAGAPGGYSQAAPSPLTPAAPDRATESAAWANAADPLARPPAPPAPSAPSAPVRAPGTADPSWLSE